jgi:hypothetical protein
MGGVGVVAEQPAEQTPESAPPQDLFEFLEFPVICDMFHHDMTDCQEPAIYFANVHHCRPDINGRYRFIKEGYRVVVCGKFVNDCVELSSDGEEAECVRCGKKFTSILDRIWDIVLFKEQS